MNNSRFSANSIPLPKEMNWNNNIEDIPLSSAHTSSAERGSDCQNEPQDGSNSTGLCPNIPSQSTRATDDGTNMNSKPQRMKKTNDTYVKHDYHDYSMVRHQDIPSSCTSSYHMNHKGGNDILFPQKLHNVLRQAETSDQDVISWAPVSSITAISLFLIQSYCNFPKHGRCFSIKNRQVFCKKYLIVNFNVKSYCSFQRQLNRYDFKSITKYGSRDRGAYYHELFLRGRPSLSQHIRGKRNKGNKYKPLASPEDEPCFYSYPPCYELLDNLEGMNVNSSSNNASIGTGSATALAHFQMICQRNAKNNYLNSPLTTNKIQHLQATRTNEISSSYICNGTNAISTLQNEFLLNEQNNTSQLYSLIPYQNNAFFANIVPLLPSFDNSLFIERSLSGYYGNSSELLSRRMIPVQQNPNSTTAGPDNQPSLNGSINFQNRRFDNAQG